MCIPDPDGLPIFPLFAAVSSSLVSSPAIVHHATPWSVMRLHVESGCIITAELCMRLAVRRSRRADPRVTCSPLICFCFFFKKKEVASKGRRG